MPIYEYRCDECGAEFETLTRAADAEAVVCRSCSSSRVKRLLSAFAVGAAAADSAIPETGPCGACGAARRGMCGE